MKCYKDFKKKKIKTMNNKMSTNVFLSKNKLSKQEEQRQYHGYKECFDGCQMGWWYGGMGEEVTGLRTYLKK